MKPLRLVVVGLACLGLAACGGSDDGDDGPAGPNREELRSYLVESQEAIKPILGAQQQAPGDRPAGTKPRTRADRLEALARDFRTASTQLGRLAPPDDLRAEHDGAVRALMAMSRDRERQAADVRAGRKVHQGVIPAFRDYRSWYDARQEAARDAGLTAAELSPVQ